MKKSTRIILIVATVAVAAGGFALGVLFPQHGKRVKAAGGAEVFYRAPVERATAEKLARFLETQGVFSAAGGKKSVQLLRPDGKGYTLRVVVRTDPAKVAERDVRGLRMLAAIAAKQVLGGAAITLQLCDKKLTPKRTIEVPRSLGDLGKLLRFAKGELYYSAPITAEQASTAGKLLLARHFFSDKGRSTVQLLSSGGGGGAVEVRFVVARDKVEKRPDVIAGFRGLVRELRLRAFPERRAVLALCDQAMDCFLRDKL